MRRTRQGRAAGYVLCLILATLGTPAARSAEPRSIAGVHARRDVARLIPTFFFRSFSQDGPAFSKGGEPGWNRFGLPDGRVGRSGAILDPHTAENTNNTVNRVRLQSGVPPTLYVHVVTDNTRPRKKLVANTPSIPAAMARAPISHTPQPSRRETTRPTATPTTVSHNIAKTARRRLTAGER